MKYEFGLRLDLFDKNLEGCRNREDLVNFSIQASKELPEYLTGLGLNSAKFRESTFRGIPIYLDIESDLDEDRVIKMVQIAGVGNILDYQVLKSPTLVAPVTCRIGQSEEMKSTRTQHTTLPFQEQLVSKYTDVMEGRITQDDFWRLTRGPYQEYRESNL